MSVYSVKGKGWRYDFTLRGIRHTEAWFKTKKEAERVEAKRREAAEAPVPTVATIQTDITFLDLVNKRLDHVKAYNSLRHYQAYMYLAKRWVLLWGKLSCVDVTQDMVEKFILQRAKVSHYTANQEIRYLRATFNFGKKKKLLKENPLDGMSFLPVEKRVKYVPLPADIDKVISEANQDTQDYLWTIRDTFGRVSEINRLTWDDVDFNTHVVILYTRKKKGGNLTARRVPMTSKVEEILVRRSLDREADKPWVFWHKYWSQTEGKEVVGPYLDRKKIMTSLCAKAGVRYFRFHALRHSGASMMDMNNVSIGTIQKILGHENRTTTEIYLHSIGDSERVAMVTYELARQKSHTDSHTDEKSTYLKKK